jgi:hypothetical protein
MNDEDIEYRNIFVVGGQPKYTYNPRESIHLEKRLKDAIFSPGKIVVVTGPTKSGKTVLVRRILPYDKAIWIDGGSISGAKSPEEEFWQVIIDNLDLAQQHTTSMVDGKNETVGTEGKIEGSVYLVKAGGQLSWDLSRKQEKTRSSSTSLSSRISAIQGIKQKMIPIVIDDFHYLPKDLQKNIIRAFKSLIFDGLQMVIITIPHRREEPIKVEREMTGRTITIEIPTWSDEDLNFIPRTGFSILGYKVPEDRISDFTQQSIGSPHLMQDFCLTLCRNKDLHKSIVVNELTIIIDEIYSVFRAVAKNMGRSMFEKLAHGPRQRSDRIERELIDGGKVDIYQLVLLALANMKPGLSSLEHEDIRASLRKIAVKLPNAQEVARVLKYMSKIAATEKSSTPVIDYDAEERKLHIIDPFFAFYLRWGELTL